MLLLTLDGYKVKMHIAQWNCGALLMFLKTKENFLFVTAQINEYFSPHQIIVLIVLLTMKVPYLKLQVVAITNINIMNRSINSPGQSAV